MVAEAELKERPEAEADEGSFVVNRDYIRAEAGEAVATFFAPFRGVYEAATGVKERLARGRKRRAA